MTITLNTGTPATRIGNFQLTGLESTLKQLDINKDGSINTLEKNNLNLSDPMTALLSAHLPAGFTITPVNVAKLEKELEVASGGSVQSDDTKPYKNTTYEDTNARTISGNPIYKSLNPFQDTRNVMFVISNDGGTTMENFTDNKVLDRSEAENIGVTLNDDEQLVVPNFSGTSSVDVPMPKNLNPLKISFVNGNVSLTLDSLHDLGDVKLLTSTNLTNWFASTNKLTYSSTNGGYSVIFPENIPKNFYKAALEPVTNVVFPVNIQARLQLIGQ